MSVNLSPIGNGFQFFTNNGTPLVAGKLETFQAGSSTPLTTFTDAGGLIANTNPIILGTDGRPPETIWLSAGFFYKFVLSDANDVQIQTYDDLYGIIGASPPAATPVPSGGILLWSGSIGSIPAGFVLCNGNNGTPDLRDRFIVGAGSTYAVNATGGSLTTSNSSITDTGLTSLTVANLPAHNHFVAANVSDQSQPALTNTNFVIKNAFNYELNGTSTAATQGLTSDTGSGTGHTHPMTHTHTSTPPFFALCYIMKT